MAILEILVAPDPKLKTRAEPVKEVTDEIRSLLDNMLETMYDAHGIGLAANQIGVLKRVLVVDVEPIEEECAHDGHTHTHVRPGKPMKFINPEIIWSSEENKPYKEGCLSFPSFYEDVIRPAEIKVKYLDEHGKPQELHATGLLATCLQHEIDHLNGVTLVDHISLAKRDLILRKLKKAKKNGDIPQRGHNPYAEEPGEAAL